MRSDTPLLRQVLCTAPDVNPVIHGCRRRRSTDPVNLL
jgi:hypothetical protein